MNGCAEPLAENELNYLREHLAELEQSGRDPA